MTYFINTSVEDALRNKHLQIEIRGTKWLQIAGFHPQGCGLNLSRDMPNLAKNREHFRSTLCRV